MRFRSLVICALLVTAALAAPHALAQLHCLGVTPEGWAAGISSDGGLATVYAQDEQEQRKEKDKEKYKEHKRGDYNDDSEFTEKDEVRQSYQLSPGALVKISGMNGIVEVETTGGTTAEVHVVRLARNRDDLNYRKVIIEQTGNSLVVRGANNRDEPRVEVRQRITMRIPRQVEFIASGINGRARVGEIDGPVRLSGINGKVEVAQALGSSEISGINGSVMMTIARIGEQGIRVSGINGGVELRFADDVNADLQVSGVNGSVNADLPNVTLQGKVSRSNFNAKIGAGGVPINVSGVNGRVRLSKNSDE